eukprot:TRINITY_DN58114_c0_g1_i2.p1 TRINITY_DN58114_c0_g1~~TRINITY_DN58114_c0_g1_i2.p1  ORF type:complete len:183 (+),score=21.93 TRINITY_DN58114_c0_g1_i2:132-680(+)
MLRSLVGSEMCIRDRCRGSRPSGGGPGDPVLQQPSEMSDRPSTISDYSDHPEADRIKVAARQAGRKGAPKKERPSSISDYSDPKEVDRIMMVARKQVRKSGRSPRRSGHRRRSDPSAGIELLERDLSSPSRTRSSERSPQRKSSPMSPTGSALRTEERVCLSPGRGGKRVAFSLQPPQVIPI